jgi:hypothetical protein
MLKHFPGKMDLIVLCVMAAVCTVIISLVHSRDTGLFFLTFPLFVCSAVMGLRKRGRLGAHEE